MEPVITDKEYKTNYFSHSLMNKMESVFKPLRQIVASLASGNNSGGVRNFSLLEASDDGDFRAETAVEKNILSLLVKMEGANSSDK
jgi:hypothetical protein